MILPRRLMDFLRSRRFRIALACSPFVLLVLTALTWWGINRYGHWRFEQTMDKLAARGFPRTMEEAMGPRPRDEDNMQANPAVLREVAAIRLSASEEEKRNGGWAKAILILDAKEREIQGPAGRAAAQELLALLEPYDAARRELMKAMGTLRPTAPDEFDPGNFPDVFMMVDPPGLFQLFEAKEALDQHGMLSLAAGRKGDAFEDFLAMLRFCAATQTTALPCFEAEGGASQFEATLRAALINPPAGTWTEDELKRFDEILKTACSGELTMKFQRMLPAILMDRMAREQAKPGTMASRFDWKVWWNFLQWVPAKESLANAWSAVRPQGLRDLEVAEGLEDLANKLGRPRTSTDWQIPPWEPKLFQEPAGLIDCKICPTIFGSELSSIYSDNFTRTGGCEIRGAMWTALARWAIALERHRLRHGRHPASLEALDEDLVRGLPCDPVSKGRFNYGLLGDGGYKLKGTVPTWEDAKRCDYTWNRVMEDAGPLGGK